MGKITGETFTFSGPLPASLWLLVCLLVFSHAWEYKNNLEFVITHNLYKLGSEVLCCQINFIRSINLIF